MSYQIPSLADSQKLWKERFKKEYLKQLPISFVVYLATMGLFWIFRFEIHTFLTANKLMSPNIEAATSTIYFYAALLFIWSVFTPIGLAYARAGKYPTAKDHAKLLEFKTFYDQMKQQS